MKILVTGSQGQVGSELIRALPTSCEVIGLNRRQLDLANADAIRATLRDIKPNLIINAAAYTAVDRAETEPELAHAVNANAVAVIGEVAHRMESAVIHYSTDYVFDGKGHAPYLPGGKTKPVSVYGQTKLDGEEALLASAAACLIFRTSWVYGLRGRNFLLAVVRSGIAKGELKVVKDQTGSPTPARLIAKMTAQIIEHAASFEGHRTYFTYFGVPSGVYHLTAAGSTTWFEFAKAIFELLPVTRKPTIRPITTAEYPTKAVRPTYSVLDCSSTDATFGLNRPHWRDALADLLQGVTVESLLAG